MFSQSIFTIFIMGGVTVYTFQPGNFLPTVLTSTATTSSSKLFASNIESSKQSNQLSDRSKLTYNSIGNVSVGMTVAEASKAAGIPIVLETSVPESGQCKYAKPQPKIEGLDFRLDGDRIVRIEVKGKSSISTSSGAKIGDTEAKIKSLYPGQIEIKSHWYISKGHYLNVVPKDLKDRTYRLVFETDGDRVTQIRSGQLPHVSNVEGCF